MKVLVVDDEEGMRQLLRRYLEKEEFQVLEAVDGEEALQYAWYTQVVLLDWWLPKIDGARVCERLRSEGYEGSIIFLTARGDVFDRLLGFALGADDYVVKPFSPLEVMARIKAMVRRKERKVWPEILERGELCIVLGGRKVFWRGREVSLTPKEYDLLVLLAMHSRQVFSREQILKTVWGEQYGGCLRTVDNHIKSLRDKFADASFFRTVWGMGYSFEPVMMTRWETETVGSEDGV